MLDCSKNLEGNFTKLDVSHKRRPFRNLVFLFSDHYSSRVIIIPVLIRPFLSHLVKNSGSYARFFAWACFFRHFPAGPTYPKKAITASQEDIGSEINEK